MVKCSVGFYTCIDDHIYILYPLTHDQGFLIHREECGMESFSWRRSSDDGSAEEIILSDTDFLSEFWTTLLSSGHHSILVPP
ncbi:hypothetical protein Tco_1043276 [Tanacetum coccineum]|uniref:Uncharacterized protein n=1 Tax=Tanacetum coccineum TaxID=301880 RepID=A0ABQ5GLR1_9ASTR